MKYKIDNKKYGEFDGFSIEFKGFEKIPRRFAPLGFKAGKYILEKLKSKLKKFKLVIDKSRKSSITKSDGSFKVVLNIKDYESVRTSFLRSYRTEGENTVFKHFTKLFPRIFKGKVETAYRKGTINRLFSEKVSIDEFSKKDIGRLIELLHVLKDYNIETKKQLDDLMEAKQLLHYLHLEKTIEAFAIKLSTVSSETSWQGFLKDNFLILNPAYIKLVEKRNISIGSAKFPDFLLVTIDSYLDVYEIKTPQTELLKFDRSHNNYFWAPEIAKAISQIENYLASIERSQDRIRSYFKDELDIELQIVRPRGFVVAGTNKQFIKDGRIDRKKQDDFRLLNRSLSNCEIILYDEYLQRLKNLSEGLKRMSSVIS